MEVLFDQSLSPAQQRNLERHLELPVNDRTLLILEIFAQRARSHEGKLQVELARLQYLSTRWCDAGRTWSARLVVSACVREARARNRLNWTAG
jgi:50S ribosomal subunit-associated GTPase HflX